MAVKLEFIITKKRILRHVSLSHEQITSHSKKLVIKRAEINTGVLTKETQLGFFLRDSML